MTPRELPRKWMDAADCCDACNDTGLGLAYALRECATELEAALAEVGDGWVKIGDIPEAWKDGRIVQAAYRSDVGPPFGPLSWISGRWHSWAMGTESARATHARLVTPPPGENGP